MTFQDLIPIIAAEGFILECQRGSHRIYHAEIEGRRRTVVVACHNMGDDIRRGTLASMIRQTGLPRNKFR